MHYLMVYCNVLLCIPGPPTLEDDLTMSNPIHNTAYQSIEYCYRQINHDENHLANRHQNRQTANSSLMEPSTSHLLC